MTSDVSVREGSLRSRNTRSAARVSFSGPAAAASPLLPPKITAKDLAHQFWLDAYGKEVQTASTYSYTWMADQVGHVCLGIVIDFALTLIAGCALPMLGFAASWSAFAGFLVGSIAVSIWEFSAYRSAVNGATGRFPLDRDTLRDNAVIASVYMIMGVGAGFAFHQAALWMAIGLGALVILAVALAPRWLRQKIVWQKAALPYLFRLADAQRSIGAAAAKELQAHIDEGAPPNTQPFQVIVGGPIGSGRTAIAAGIGTEFAFKNTKVRYLSVDTLLECAARSSSSRFEDDTGPANVDYWLWNEAQVIIIDDIGPLIAARDKAGQADLDKFREMLCKDLAKIICVLRRCHTVWVFGDLCPASQWEEGVLDPFADVIAKFCEARRAPLVVVLSEVPVPAERSRARPGLDPAMNPARLHRVARQQP